MIMPPFLLVPLNLHPLLRSQKVEGQPLSVTTVRGLAIQWKGVTKFMVILASHRVEEGEDTITVSAKRPIILGQGRLHKKLL